MAVTFAAEDGFEPFAAVDLPAGRGADLPGVCHLSKHAVHASQNHLNHTTLDSIKAIYKQIEKKPTGKMMHVCFICWGLMPR